MVLSNSNSFFYCSGRYFEASGRPASNNSLPSIPLVTVERTMDEAAGKGSQKALYSSDYGNYFLVVYSKVVVIVVMVMEVAVVAVVVIIVIVVVVVAGGLR